MARSSAIAIKLILKDNSMVSRTGISRFKSPELLTTASRWTSRGASRGASKWANRWACPRPVLPAAEATVRPPVFTPDFGNFRNLTRILVTTRVKITILTQDRILLIVIFQSIRPHRTPQRKSKTKEKRGEGVGEDQILSRKSPSL